MDFFAKRRPYRAVQGWGADFEGSESRLIFVVVRPPYRFFGWVILYNFSTKLLIILKIYILIIINFVFLKIIGCNADFEGSRG